MQNITLDDLTVNDKSMRCMGKKLEDDKINFNVKEQ